MKRIVAIITAALLIATTQLSAQEESAFAKIRDAIDSPTAALTDIAQQLTGTPYGSTLDGDTAEQLVARLDSLDCVTFVETALALWRSNLESWSAFTDELQHIRYRNGTIDGYASRLHYTTDWIGDNVRKGTIADITQTLGGIVYDKQINFMSLHPDRYPALGNDTAQLAAVRHIEDSINRHTHYFIPKECVADIDTKIPEGAIIAITSTIDGLDCMHVGFAVKRNNHTHLLHASSRQKEICIGSKTLSDYLKSIKKAGGIIILQPLKR